MIFTFLSSLASARARILAELASILNIFDILKSIKYTLSFIFTYSGPSSLSPLETFFTFLVQSLKIFWSYSWGDEAFLRYIIESIRGIETPVKYLFTVNTIDLIFLSSSSNNLLFNDSISILFALPSLSTTLITSLFIFISYRRFSIALHASTLGRTIIVCLQTLLPSTDLFFKNAKVSELSSPKRLFINPVISFSYLKRPDLTSKSAVNESVVFDFLIALRQSFVSLRPILWSVGTP